MKRHHFFPALAGFYVLTADARLGYYDQDQRFVLDPSLSQAFGEYNDQFLRAYLESPSSPEIRLGIVYQPTAKRKWGSETLALETSILKRLYGVSGRPGDPLTEFQKKNREQSIYRGMELFLEYRNDHFPDAAIYAPVLFDRNTTLDAYPSVLDRSPETGDQSLRVLEVLNLLAGAAIPKRNTDRVHLLVKTLHKSVVRKDMRKAVNFDLVGRVDTRPLVFDVASIQADRDVKEATSLAETRVGAQAGVERGVSQEQGTGKTEHQVKPEILARFAQFRSLSEEKRELLARTHPARIASSGSMLLRRGAIDSWNFYLLEGKLELTAKDGAKQIIEGGTSNASSPISFLKPRKYDVTALTPVRFLWIHDSLLAAIVYGDLPTKRVREAAGPTHSGIVARSVVPHE